MFHRVLLTHALALSAIEFVHKNIMLLRFPQGSSHKKKSQRVYTSVHSAGLELTKLTYILLEHYLICHRGDRLIHAHGYNIISLFF